MTTTPAPETAAPESLSPESLGDSVSCPASPTASGGGAITSDVIDVNQIADLIARDGVSAHHQALAGIADRAGEADVLPGASAVLRDSKAPEAARARAFLAIVRQWDSISVAVAQKAAFDRSFAALATQWVAHQELRGHGAISELAQSSERLSELRLETRHCLAGR